MAGFSDRLTAEEEGIGTSMDSFQKCLESQKGLFHSQIDQMRTIVVTQCRLTGVNPLSQEMAAGALGIPIGKKPRDLLNPKAVAYMQEVFAIKDKISKKETREISALFGITLAQIRDFFASQRIRVRDIVQSSQEVFRDRSNILKQLHDGNQDNKDPVMPGEPLLSLTADPGTRDTNTSTSVGLATNESASEGASAPNVTPFRCDSPEFSLATCIPITDEEDIPGKPCKSEVAPPNSMTSTFAEYFPLNVVPITSSESLVSNNDGIGNNGKHSQSRQEEVTPGLDGSDKFFVENIFNLMSKSKTFSGQVKLMEGILKIDNPSLLDWFLSKGGVMILATWLGEAAIEEQTSVLHVILKVLCHLPLAKAVPEHMSVVLQSVNSLRFYRTQDISKKSRILLARWSKLFAKSQPMRTTNGVKSRNDVTKQTLLSQSIKEVIGDESRQLQLEDMDGKQTLSNQASVNLRKRERPLPVKLLTSSANEATKRKSLGPSPSQSRDRRKVQLVEHPGQKLTGRSQQGARTSVSQSRPVSTDDIQKAKLRKEFMEAKYGKKKPETESGKPGISHASQVSTEPVSHECKNPRLSIPKTIIENKTATIPHSYHTVEKKHNLFPLGNKEDLKQSMVSVQRSILEFEQPAAPLLYDTKKQPMMNMEKTYSEQPMVPLSSSKTQSHVYPENGAMQRQSLVSVTGADSTAEPPIKFRGTAEQRVPIFPDPSNNIQQNVHRPKKTIPESKEPFWKQCKRVQIPWKVPPEMVINKEWQVVCGQDSRELRDQKSRNKREKEFVYQRPEEIPQNPKNPWENEIDYDDSLTPIIPTEQVLDTADTLQSQIPIASTSDTVPQRVSVPPTGVSTTLPGGVSSTVHDPVLLDALLKNPALVFTLTSGQGANMTSEETVRLLDLIKATGGAFPTGNITHSLAKSVQEAEERVEDSLPSPTPSSKYGTSGWQPEVGRNPFSRNSPTPNTGMYAYQGVASPAYDKLPHANLVRTQVSSANILQQLESPTPQFPPPQTFGAQYNSNFSHSILDSPTPHGETNSSVNPYHHSVSSETSMFENRSAVGYNPMQVYSSYPSGQSQQQPAYDLQSQPAHYSSGRLQSQSIYEHQLHRQSPTYVARGQYGSVDSVSDSWRQRGLTADSNAQVNSNHYGSTHRYKDDNVASLNQFESWSPPHNSPSMSVDYVSQPRTAYGSNYRPEQAKPKYPSGYGGTNQNGNGWWNGNDRRR